MKTVKWLLVIGTVCGVVVYLAAMIHGARAHDTGHPEHDEWFKSLTNSSGTPCCDGSEAMRVEDVDWQTVCEAGTNECHYQVFIEKAWWNVPPSAVVQGANRVGPAIVWPTLYWVVGDPANGISSVLVRCFLPGAGT